MSCSGMTDSWRTIGGRAGGGGGDESVVRKQKCVSYR